jgi:glutaredoxin-related protein
MKRTVAIECGFAGKMVWLLDDHQKNSFNLGKKINLLQNTLIDLSRKSEIKTFADWCILLPLPGHRFWYQNLCAAINQV